MIPLSELVSAMENAGFEFYGEYHGRGYHEGWGFSGEGVDAYDAGVAVGRAAEENVWYITPDVHVDSLGRGIIISFNKRHIKVDMDTSIQYEDEDE